jgi:hypothetical protein
LKDAIPSKINLYLPTNETIKLESPNQNFSTLNFKKRRRFEFHPHFDHSLNDQQEIFLKIKPLALSTSVFGGMFIQESAFLSSFFKKGRDQTKNNKISFLGQKIM